MASDPGALDLLHLPVIGRFLRWRHARTVSQIPLLLIAIVMIVHGLFGPDLAPKNLATTLTWVHFRGALVLVLLCAGNFFCMACPFLLVRQAARKLWTPRLNWPRRLRNKWVSVALFALILFVYELFDLWSTPWWTAWLILGYFAAVALQGVLGLFAALLLVLVVCAALVGTFKLCTGMGFSMASRVILLVLMFVPLVSLIVLLVLNAKATARLRAAGYHVGLLGARR